MTPRSPAAHLLPLAVLSVVLVAALVFAPQIRRSFSPEEPVPPKPREELVIDIPKGWIEIPGKLSRTYRSPRPGAGLLQFSTHPPLDPRPDGPGTEKEFDTMLREIKTEMEFGKRLEIGHTETKAGPLAFARYQSPKNGILGFWLLSSDRMIFATYVDGGPGTAEKDLPEAHKAFLDAHFEPMEP